MQEKMKKIFAYLVLGLSVNAGIAMAENHQELAIECEYVETNEQYVVFKCEGVSKTPFYFKFSTDIITEELTSKIMATMSDNKDILIGDLKMLLVSSLKLELKNVLEETEVNMKRDATEAADKILSFTQEFLVKVYEKFVEFEGSMDSMGKRITYLEDLLEVQDRRYAQVFPPYTNSIQKEAR